MKNYFVVIIIIFVQQANAQVKPVFTTRDKSRVSIDSMYNYRFEAIDSAGRKINYVAGALPAWLRFNKSYQTISGKPLKAGQYPIHLRAIAGKDTTSQRFMLTVYNNETVNILAAGNSITNGTDTFNSYRRRLWTLLHDQQYNFDFIGSWNKHHMGGEVPDPDFDMDHEGHSGWTFDHFFNPPSWDSAKGNIYSWLRIYKPDVILLELGTNDVFQCRKTGDMIANLSKLVEVFRTANLRAKIFVAQIPPLGPKWSAQDLCSNGAYSIWVNALNNEIAAFAMKNTTTVSPITVVDQFTGIDAGIHMYDDIHPNDAGEKIMAQRWFDAIEKILPKLK